MTTDLAQNPDWWRRLLWLPFEAIRQLAVWWRKVTQVQFRSLQFRPVLPAWLGSPIVFACVFAAAVALLMVFVDPLVLRPVREFPEWVRTLFAITAHLGKGYWMIPLFLMLSLAGLVASVVLMHKRAGTAAAHAGTIALYIFTCLSVPGGAVLIVKQLVGRARPYWSGPINQFEFKPLTFDAFYASFPSGDAFNAAALATALGLCFPSLRVPLAIYVVWVAFGRVALRAHYVSDVVVGVAAGFFGAVLVARWSARRNLVFTTDAEGRLRLKGMRALQSLSDARSSPRDASA